MSDADDSEDDGVPSIIISDRATLSDLSVGDTETKTSDVNRVVSNKVSRITKCLNNLDISSQIDFSMTNKDTTVSCIDGRTGKVEEIVAPENVAGNSTEAATESLLNINGDYKALYEESQRKLSNQQERFRKKVIQLATDYDIMKEQYEDMSNKKSENEHQKDSIENEHQNDSIVYSIETASDFDIGSEVCTLKGCVMGENKFMLNVKD